MRLVWVVIPLILIGIVGISESFATLSLPIDKTDASWYLGEGLKEGDYFEYSLCEIDLNDCSPIKFKMWVKGIIPYETETLWDVEVVIIDGNKIIKGSMGLGTTAPEPITFDDDLFHYAIAYKSSIAWLTAFATAHEGDRIHGPQAFKSPAWGKIGAIGGAQLTPRTTETITIPAGTVDTVVVGWYSGQTNKIWIVDDFPFPVKALTYTWITTGVAPIMHQYTLLDYKENVMDDPFKDVVETIPKEELLGCPTEFSKHVGKHVNLNTYKMLIQYKYAPEYPTEGCTIDFIINFMNPFNDVEFIDQVHYDIWVIDDNGNKVRTISSDEGKPFLYSPSGQVRYSILVKEPPGTAHYVILIYGLSPEHIIPSTAPDILKIDILISGGGSIIKPPPVQTLEIPSWIKNNARWWADNQIDDNSFVQGIQYLIKEDIMTIPLTSQGTGSSSNEIPDWIRNNAGWWADGQITDSDFVQGIQYLIKEGIMRIA